MVFHDSFPVEEKILPEQLNDILSYQDENYGSHPSELHREKVMQHLLRLANPQGELTYLTQHLKWQIPLFDRSVQDNKVVFFCKINWKWRGEEGTVLSAVAAANKKEGKFLSSLKALKKIYLGSPEIWEKFSQVRQEKNLDIAMGGENGEWLKVIQKEEQFEQEASSRKVNKEEEEIKAYLEGVACYKMEMSRLVQHNHKQIQLPVHSKEKNNALWKVVSTIKVENKVKVYLFKEET